MTAETLSPVDAADMAFWPAKLFGELLHDANPKKAPIPPTECFTDNRQLLEAACSIMVVQDKLLRIDTGILH